MEQFSKAHAGGDPDRPGFAEPDTPDCPGLRGATAFGLSRDEPNPAILA